MIIPILRLSQKSLVVTTYHPKEPHCYLAIIVDIQKDQSHKTHFKDSWYVYISVSHWLYQLRNKRFLQYQQLVTFPVPTSDRAAGSRRKRRPAVSPQKNHRISGVYILRLRSGFIQSTWTNYQYCLIWLITLQNQIISNIRCRRWVPPQKWFGCLGGIPPWLF